MPIVTRQIKDAGTATKKWTTGVGNAGQAWADGYAAPRRNPFDPANINVDGWVAGVTNPAAATAYEDHMASVDQNMVLTTVNGAGKAKYVAAGTTRAANTQKALSKIIAFESTQLSSLNQSSPRGPAGSPQNKTRQDTWFDMMHGAKGTLGARS